MKAGTIIAIVLGVFAFYSFNNSQPAGKPGEGIEFHTGTWQEALDKAKEENKIIFLDAYASWCGPCKLMKRKTFSNKAVGKYYNKKFINVAMDMEKGEGPALARKYPIKGYPTLLYINAEGKVVAETMGYYRTDEFIKLGEQVSKLK